MNISLDYDGTYTEDKEFWDDFIDSAHDHGHKIWIVTLRSGEHDKIEEWFTGCIPIVYCSGRPKEEVVREMGEHINIWIDDQPNCITKGSSLTPDQVSEWEANFA